MKDIRFTFNEIDLSLALVVIPLFSVLFYDYDTMSVEWYKMRPFYIPLIDMELII